MYCCDNTYTVISHIYNHDRVTNDMFKMQNKCNINYYFLELKLLLVMLMYSTLSQYSTHLLGMHCPNVPIHICSVSNGLVEPFGV